MRSSERLAYLERAYEQIRETILPDVVPIDMVLLAVALPRKGGACVGTCQHDAFQQKDKFKGPIVTLHPVLLEDPVETLATLLHEMLHAVLGPDVKAHGQEFKALAEKVGFLKPFTKSVPDTALVRKLRDIVSDLGEFPAAAYDPPPPPPPRESKSRKYTCTCEPKPRALTLSPARMEEGAIKCLACGSLFEVREGAGATRKQS